MCTLIALHHAVSGYPLVVGMNRDERRDRPSAPWSVYSQKPRIAAPRDARAGGTWIGVNEYGLAAALSNRRGRESATAKSRGLLVASALERERPVNVDFLVRKEVAESEYNFFHLWAANREEMRCWRYDGSVMGLRGGPGVNVLSNRGFNEFGDPKALAVRQIVRAADVGEIGSAVRALQTALRYHAADAEICNHGALAGTVSSSVLALHAESGRENLLLYADGLPCQGVYRDISELLR